MVDLRVRKEGRIELFIGDIDKRIQCTRLLHTPSTVLRDKIGLKERERERHGIRRRRRRGGGRSGGFMVFVAAQVVGQVHCVSWKREITWMGAFMRRQEGQGRKRTE